MELLTFIILSVIFTEAVTEVVTKSEIFTPFRALIFRIGKKVKIFEWLHRLLDCGYCFSVWAGLFASGLILSKCFTVDIIFLIVWFVFGIVIHRLSNLWHDVLDYLSRKL